MAKPHIEVWLETDYQGWHIRIEKRVDGTWYVVTHGSFRAEYGNFVGPETAFESAKMLVGVLVACFDW